MGLKIKDFCKKKDVAISAKRYFIDAGNSMALGLFASLLIGTILHTIGANLGITFLSDTVWPVCKEMTGPAIGTAIAFSLKAPPFVLFSSVSTGYIGNKLGGPLGAYLAVLVSTEIGKLVSKETKIDLIVTPAVTIITGVLTAVWAGPAVSAIMSGLGSIIIKATELHPFWMGIIISIVVGMILTLPISSAAICLMLSLKGLAGGAATAGCCAQMIGFAVMTYCDNGFGTCFPVGIGTSMLHIPNIIKNWKIWIPPTLTAAITGPISTIIMKMENSPIGSGMGTSGLAGQISTIAEMTKVGKSGGMLYFNILILHFLLPAFLTWCFYIILKKINLIKKGDLKLDL